MIVSLVSYSQPPKSTATHNIDHKSLKEMIIYCARVSNPSNQSSADTDDRLLKYLANNSHWSPFEMVNVCLYIETTRDIARQVLRHRSFSFQEFSQRYANPVSEFKFTYRDARFQDKTNRQNSIEMDPSDPIQRALNETFRMKQAEHIRNAKDIYKWALDNGIAKEQARVVLPEGNTTSRMYMNGTLRSWLHYIELREGNGTQLEHMMIAKQCAKVIHDVFPVDFI